MDFGNKIALKIILIGGVCVFILLNLLASRLRSNMAPDEGQRVTAEAQSPFDGERAFADAAALVAMGPRSPGSDGLAAARAYIAERLAAAGLEVRRHPFQIASMFGDQEMENIFGVVEGTEPGVIVLGCHYDTKSFPDFRFVGANDGAAANGWMLEMARTLGPEREGRSVWLCFFDGNESPDVDNDRSACRGSLAFVEWLKERGELAAIDAMLNVSMIGDCYLALGNDAGGPAWLKDTVRQTAAALGLAGHFGMSYDVRVADDHTAFRDAGVPALNLVDFSYGGSPLAHRQNWHTAEDKLDRVCWRSLQATGDVIYHALPEIDRTLDQRAAN